MKNAIILCSGGLDSVVTSHYVKKKLKYNKTIILFFNYKQRTLKQERKCSKLCAKQLNSYFYEIKLPFLAKISHSLININKIANKVTRKQLKNTKKESQNYYVPCRNIIFLTYAMALADSLFIKNKEIYDIFTGFKCEGKDPYPDTTSEFVKSINNLMKTIKIKGMIIAPLIKKDKDEIIKLGEKLKVNFKDTYSCYIGAGKKHCGTCLSCRLKQEAFYWANIKDSTNYKEKMKDFRLAG